MLDFKNTIGFKWYKNGEGKRYKIHLFKCIDCPNIIKSRKCYFKKHQGRCPSCSCKRTIRSAIAAIRKRPYEARYNNFIRRIKEDNTKTDVTYEMYLDFTKILNCHYCSFPIPWEPYGENTPGFFLDRKDNNISHISNNLVVCCKICNFTKRNEFSYEEFLLIGTAIKEIRKRRK